MAEVSYKKILLYPKLDLDVVVALFLLQNYGTKYFPGIDRATVEFVLELPIGETGDTLEQKGIMALDLGGGRFDHHRMSREEERLTVTDLVAMELGISGHEAFRKLVAVVRRDDLEGKGTISRDQLDRTFGLSAIHVNLCRRYEGDLFRAIHVMHEIIGAHLVEEIRRVKHLPEEFSERSREGNIVGFQMFSSCGPVRIVMVKSDTVGLVGYLRSSRGMRADIVVQFRSSGHINLITRQSRKLDLAGVVREIRLAELRVKGIEVTAELEARLSEKGRIAEVPEWYFDTAAMSLQNGGVVPESAPATKLTPADIRKAIITGLSKDS